MAIHNVALDIHCKAGMKALRKKSVLLTAYMEFIIKEISQSQAKISFEIISPVAKDQRGSQLSLLVHGGGKEIFDELAKEGAILDWREPNVIRLAPVPLYNSFTDVFEFGQLLKKIIS